MFEIAMKQLEKTNFEFEKWLNDLIPD